MNQESKNKIIQRLWKIILVAVWVTILIVLVIHRKDLTVSEVLEFTPANPWIAAFVLLGLFALKSISIIIYSGILFTASGILFPLPVAIFLNILGLVIMATIPYLIGRCTGASAVDRILNKYPKATHLRQLRQENDFLFALSVRLFRILPSDVVSLYMGAIEMQYKNYLLGSLIGMLPSAISFAVMGINITDITSPQFIVALCVELLCIAISIVLYQFHKKERNDENG